MAQKKCRQKAQLFLVEGDKNVLEVLESDIAVAELYATGAFINTHRIASKAEALIEADDESIRRASLLVQPQSALALCRIPSQALLPDRLRGLSLYLDGIRDPGNLGTIIRTCAWFGVSHLLCSPDTADLYNPKVIQASMGTFSRVKTTYTPFEAVAALVKASGGTIWGTFMQGNNLYATSFSKNALIVLGNEGNGIRDEIAAKIDQPLTIPSFAATAGGAESLNVAMAAAIICGEFQRQQLPIQSGRAG